MPKKRKLQLIDTKKNDHGEVIDLKVQNKSTGRTNWMSVDRALELQRTGDADFYNRDGNKVGEMRRVLTTKPDGDTTNNR